MGFEMNAVRGRKPADDQAIAQENQKTGIGSMTKAARELGANREKRQNTANHLHDSFQFRPLDYKILIINLIP
jgi:hypothetical protein